ncbi:sentrin-specific protease 6 isoform X2 [Cynoglossus semilaevis]|uniref:sentrin-specific protease 6 isoform X2 n=1 Tax=Cynoglossus semilaevis TaxID=244447 RepID=UPI000D6254E2|nr:sentrin-specific protease 6 isoform X2 [Cynoglossus semilaevis]
MTSEDEKLVRAEHLERQAVRIPPLLSSELNQDHGINMANNRSLFFEALNRSESRRDGGYKNSWSFSLSTDSEEQRRHDGSVVNMEEMDRPQVASAEEKKSPALRHLSSSDPLRTYGNRSNIPMRPQNRVGTKKSSDFSLTRATSSPPPSRTNYLILNPAPSQGVVLQGRHFQHAQLPSVQGKPVQSTEQPEEVDRIALTCPESPEDGSLSIRRRVQQKKRPVGDCCPLASQLRAAECNRSSGDRGECQICGPSASAVAAVLPPCQQATLSSPTPRPPIRSQTSMTPNNLLQQNFYAPAATAKVTRSEVLPLRVSNTRGSALPLNNSRTPLLAGTSGCCGARKPTNGKRTTSTQQHELNDPIVLSSDEEEEEADNASTGSVNRLDSVSPRPADSAHSSPAPSGGRVEAAVKSVGEQEEVNMEFFEDVNMKVMIPRRARMKDQFGNQPAEQFPPRAKKSKCTSEKCDSIILECRSVRVGTLRRMVTKPVVFSIKQIQLETEVPGPQPSTMEVCLWASELTSCEWCSVRKLPVLFFQTTPLECVRLRTQLSMSPEQEGHWYDCSGGQSDEKYIVLIFENGLTLKEHMILEEILAEIGRTNRLENFPTKLTFDEANARLVNYNKASRQKEDKVMTSLMTSPMTSASPHTNCICRPLQAKPGQTSSKVIPACKVTLMSNSVPGRTRMSTRQHTSTFFSDEDEDMTDLQPTFSGPIIKLMVYPPPPSKGGISVTNEDLHCLNEGEFLNDVIIDFYLKYLVLEKLKKEEAQRIHIFSSFFYKRLNQRERRNLPDTSNLPIQKRKHNRVKTWTRHVDLFQKDFIFVPINESAHWYLAVICFPGLDGPDLPCDPRLPPDHPTADEHIPDHCRPLSPDRDGLDGGSEQASPGGPEAQTEVQFGSVQSELEQQFSSECPLMRVETCQTEGPQGPQGSQGDFYRISVCYGASKDEEETFTFSDHSSSQDELSEDGTLTDDPVTAGSSTSAAKAAICKQPCILIMDSLRGPARSTVVKTLREYLEVEWAVRKGTERSFGKEVMKGSSPRVPQQDNFSDCGVYVLQYVESFFQNPIRNFQLPLNLGDWFPQQRMRRKREEIRELILEIQTQQEQQQELQGEEGPRAGPVQTPPTFPQEPDLEETPDVTTSQTPSLAVGP